MPTTRAKSCYSCRLAKAKCSLQNPCSRCTKRSLECMYTPAQSGQLETGTDRFREIRPALKSASFDHVPAPQEDGHLVATLRSSAPEALAVEVDSGYATPNASALSLRQGSECSDLLNSYNSTAAVNIEQPSPLQQPGETTPFVVVSSDRLPDSLLSLTADGLSTLCLPVPPSLERETPTSHVPLGQSTPLATLNPAHISSRSVDRGPQLTQRGRSLQQGSLTAKMLLGRLADYTRVMADCKQFPPFIHPPCSSEGGHGCLENSAHQCLPPVVATCANLIHAFYTRASKESLVVWEHIFQHLRVMRAEHERYDEQTMLQAMQAAVLYGILCSQCPAEQSSEYYGLVVMCIEVSACSAWFAGAWKPTIVACLTNNGLSSRALEGEFEFIPSAQLMILTNFFLRLAGTLYLIDLLLQSDAETPSRGNCETFWNMPLPCSRELWLTTSYKSWRQPYEIQTSDKMLPKKSLSLTLGDLLAFRQAKRLDEVVVKTGGSAFAEELAEWCERADDLSMLLWMALTVEGEGQSIRAGGAGFAASRSGLED